MIRKVYLDMDGVLAHFDEMILKIRKGDTSRLPDLEFWKLVSDTPEFWESLPLFPGAKELYSYVRSLGVPIDVLTAPSRTDTRCYVGKILWLKKHGFDVDNIHFARASYKWVYAQPDHLLIDDHPMNVEGWIENGGHGILHTDLDTTLKQIKELKNVSSNVTV